MIVRIMADNQYRIDEKHTAAIAEIDRLDGELLAAVEANDDRAFHAALTHLINHVRRLGQPIADAELVASDVIVPPADMTLAETQGLLMKPAVSLREAPQPNR
jgi:hypothetical protein